jgi:hypothetical protein
MNIAKIHKLFLSNNLLFFTIVFAFIAVRLYPIVNQNQWDNLSLWACLLIQIGIAFFLLQLNHTFNIIPGRTFLPASFYLLLIGCNPVFNSDLKGSITALCFVFCYYFLFDSYQKPKSQINAMNISILLVLGSLLWTPFLFFFPFFWQGFYRFKCLNMRVFFASLTGFVIVYLFTFALSLFQEDRNIFFSLLPQFDSLFVIQKPDFTVFEWISCGFLLFIYLITGIYLFFFNISERIWTISVLSYFFFSIFFMFIFLFLQSEYKSSWGLIISIPIAFLTGHFFSHSNKRGIQYLLLLFFLFFIGIGIFQYIGA